MAEKYHTHRIVVCTLCRHTGRHCKPGTALIEKLNSAIAIAGLASDGDFTVEGTACMAGCSRPCTVAFSAGRKVTYLFGDIDNHDDITALVEFAQLYARRKDGMSNSIERPAQLNGKTLARIPASIIQSETSDWVLQ